MSQTAVQDMKNHARYIPLFHFVAGPILLVNFVYSIVLAVRIPIWDNIDGALVGLALLVLFFSVRGFATTLQDRVIRLEEQVRFDRLLPADLRTRIPEFTRDQFVALRFASDGE